MSDRETQATDATQGMSRAVLNERARLLATALKTFIVDADQFISRINREDLARASFRLKEFSGDI